VNCHVCKGLGPLLLLLLLLPLHGGLDAVGPMQRAVLQASDEEGDGVHAAHGSVEQQPRDMECAGGLAVDAAGLCQCVEDAGENMKQPGGE
jgi:hypothetical protein